MTALRSSYYSGKFRFLDRLIHGPYGQEYKQSLINEFKEQQNILLHVPDRFFISVKEKSKEWFLIKDIMRIESNAKSCKIVLFHNGKFIERFSAHHMGYVKEKLNLPSFRLIHESHLINIDLIKDINEKQHWVEMLDGKVIEVSRRRRVEFFRNYIHL